MWTLRDMLQRENRCRIYLVIMISIHLQAIHVFTFLFKAFL